MTSDRVIKEAPVPVKGFHYEGGGKTNMIASVEVLGWITNYQDALGEVEWARGNGVGGLVAFLMSDGSKVVVNARGGPK